MRNIQLIYSLMERELMVVADCSLNMNGQCCASVKKEGKCQIEMYKQEHSLPNTQSISSIFQPWNSLRYVRFGVSSFREDKDQNRAVP